jgi:hypothetical protein
MFISYGTNPGLGKELWETPFGEVIEGMEHVEQFYSYGAFLQNTHALCLALFDSKCLIWVDCPR